MSRVGENTAGELFGLKELLSGLALARSLADFDFAGLEAGFLFEGFFGFGSVVAFGWGFFLGFFVCCLLDSTAAA